MSTSAASDDSDRTGENWGNFAFASVLLASFGQLTLSSRLAGEPWQIVVVFALGAVYGVLAVLSGRWTTEETPHRRSAYFVLQFLICIALIAFSPNRSFFWMVVLPLAAQAIFELRWPWALAITAGLFGLAIAGIWVPHGRQAGLSVLVGFAPAFIFTAVFSYLTKGAFESRRRAEHLSRELEAANARLREQSAQADELATTRERNRLAREIHDGLGHYLTVIHVQLAAARALLEHEPARVADPLAKAERLAREALDEVRASVSNLHRDAAPPALPERLRALAADAGLEVACHVHGAPRPLNSAAEHALFRAAQEGLTNVRKHAGPARAEVVLDFRAPERIQLLVTDDGAGSNGRRAPGAGGFGLRGMRERVELLGGQVHAGARAGQGYELRVELPG